MKKQIHKGFQGIEKPFYFFFHRSEIPTMFPLSPKKSAPKGARVHVRKKK